MNSKKKPTLYIFAGLPASGKTTLAERLAAEIGALFLRIDTVEQGLRDLCSFDVQGEGYRLSYRIAKDNLLLGHDVVADSCNPLRMTRDEWQEVAVEAGAEHQNIEVICSDKAQHKQRAATRSCSITNLALPTWSQIENREYHQWHVPRHVIDTAGKEVEESVAELLEVLDVSGIGSKNEIA